MQEIINKIQTVNSKEDFIGLVELLIKDLKSNREGWGNKSVESYLGAIASWTDDMDGYYENMNLPIPENVDWKVFANILVAAKMYE